MIACNTTTTSLSNHDLLEKWHPLVVPPTDGGGVTATDLPAADRRQAAVARLRHKASGRIVCVVAVHLMTTSRDGPGVTRFPGEVRAGELATIKNIVAERAARDDAVVLCGDFNTPPSDKHVWSGDVGFKHATGWGGDGAFFWGADLTGRLRARARLGGLRGRVHLQNCLLYTSPSPRDKRQSRMPSSA